MISAQELSKKQTRNTNQIVDDQVSIILNKIISPVLEQSIKKPKCKSAIIDFYIGLNCLQYESEILKDLKQDLTDLGYKTKISQKKELIRGKGGRWYQTKTTCIIEWE
jgi:hypothetical protein